MRSSRPSVLLCDGDYDNTLAIARELTEDLGATIVGAGTTAQSRLLRSKYCDVGRIVPPAADPLFDSALLSVIETHRPDMVLPIGYDSMATVQEIRSAIPDSVALSVPSPDAFEAAADKATTLSRGRSLGLDTPADHSAVVADLDEDGRPELHDTLPFPVFCKARRENGHAATEPVEEPAAFWDTYDRIKRASSDGDVLVQEYIDNDGITYGCGMAWFDGAARLTATHEELRSVPRHGGSGTQLRLSPNERLEAQATRLLDDLDWRGIALVEFKQRSDGSFVLMEINPKFWASYALASRHGYRFASTLVARRLDLDVEVPIETPTARGEMLFPLRELQFTIANRPTESVSGFASTLVTSSAPWDVDRSDLGAWLTPPATLLQQLPGVETGSDIWQRRSGGGDDGDGDGERTPSTLRPVTDEPARAETETASEREPESISTNLSVEDESPENSGL